MSQQTLRDARDSFFERWNLDESTYTADWVDIRIWKLSLRFPNTKARRRAVMPHDCHHALTGYGADLKGEIEIAAFELASGWRPHWVGLALNLMTFSYGWLWAPARCFRAFVRGRKAQNLFENTIDDRLLERPITELREDLHIEPAPAAGALDVVAYLAWLALAMAWGLFAVVTIFPIMVVLGALSALRSRAALRAV